jgi:hypothetical protein
LEVPENKSEAAYMALGYCLVVNLLNGRDICKLNGCMPTCRTGT